MKLSVLRPVEIDVSFLRISIPVRNEEEDISNDFPLRKGDVWNAVIAIDEKKIVDWPIGHSRSFSMKVCDGGTYELLDVRMNRVAIIEQDYVPNEAIPGKWGDYIEIGRAHV